MNYKIIATDATQYMNWSFQSGTVIAENFLQSDDNSSTVTEDDTSFDDWMESIKKLNLPATAMI